MGVQIQRLEPVEAPPVKEVVVVGDASKRGFRVRKSFTGFVITGVKDGGRTTTRDPHGFTVRLRRDDALELINALTELVTR